MKWVIIIAGIIVVLAVVVGVLLLGTQWAGFEPMRDGIEDSQEYPEVDYMESTVGYREKFDSAQNMLNSAGLDETGDYLVVIDISEQKEYIFSSEGSLIDVYKISTGSSEVFAPSEEEEEEGGGEDSDEEEDDFEDDDFEDRSFVASIWRVVLMRDENLNAFYGPRLMLLDRLDRGVWIRTEVALHGTDKPEQLGAPSSLGCVYHENADIIALYDLVEIGTYVVAIR